MKRVVLMLISLILGITVLVSPCFADDDAYTYKVTVYAGQQGQFADGKAEISFEAGYGQLITIDIAELGIETTNSKYYIKGLREAGHDNEESVTTGYQSLSFRVEEDIAYVVTYAVAGDLVKYTVRFVDESGKELLPSTEYFGMENDKPVVSHKYVEGYLPNAYNETKTLSANEADNLFTFVYHRVETPQGTTTVVTVPAPAAAAQGGGAAIPGVNIVPEQAPPANQNGGGEQQGNTEPQTIVDLDENQTPLAPGQNSEPQSSDISSVETPTDRNKVVSKNGSKAVLYTGIGLLAAAGIAAGIFIALRRRRNEQ
ncbi:MAG: hypothetical protein IKE18_03015 [Oscillospiraceae bacterium]|nr:hypothetical protein [Oscillospiraceae bacterium]